MSMTLPRAVPRGRQGPPGPAGANGTTTATGSTGTFTVNGDASDAELALVAKRQGSDYNNSIITFTAPRGDTADNGISANRGAVVLPGRSNVNNSSLFIVVNTANIVESDTYADFQNYGGAIELSTDSSSLFRLWRTDTNYFEVDTSAAYRNGNKIWDAGNDGAGSGLDADLLDGNQASYFQVASDERIKTDIRPLEPVMDRLLQLDMKRFKITDEAWSHVPTIGVIAQQLEQLFPEFVYEQNGRKLVHYGPLASVAIQGLQELNARMERIERLLHNDTES